MESGAVIDPGRPARLAERAAPYAEVVASLGVTLGATLALAVAILVPLMLFLHLPPLTVEVPLVPRTSSSSVAVPELIAALNRERVARDVAVIRGAGGERLVLSGVGSGVAAERAVLVALASGGFETAFDFRPYRDPEALVEDMRVIVPLLAVQAGIFLLAGWVLIRMRVPHGASPGRSGNARAAIAGAGAGLAAVALGSGVGWLLEAVGLPVSEQEVLARLLGDPSKLLGLAPWIVLAAPLAEEIFFRGYVFRFLSLRSGVAAGYVVSSFLFAAVHLNLSGFAVYAIVGAIFALVYQRTSNLLAPVAAHMTYNGILILTVALFGI